MSGVTITVTEVVDGVSVESNPTAITVFDGVFVDSGGGGGGAVDSVNGKVGVVVLTASDVSAQPVDTDLTAIAALPTTTFGRSLLTQADAATARATLGAGTSSLAIGTSSTTAKAGNYQPTAANISDASTIGKTVLTSADAAAVRTAIGAGTSSLALGTTGTTAAAGNDSRLSDARTPTAHKATHATGGTDALTPSDIGAAAATHTHAESDVTGLTADLAAKAPLASPALTGTPTAPTQTAGNNSTRLATTAYADNAVTKQPEILMVAVSDEATAITTGTAKVTFRMPFAMTLTSVRASLTTASSSGNPAIDVNEGGVSIFSTTLTIDATEKTSTTAAVAAVISDASLADDAEITVDIDTAGTGAKGLKVTFIGTRT